MSKKKVVSMLLALTLCVLFLFEGCGSQAGTSKGDQSQSGTSAGQTTAEQTTAVKPDPFGKYDPAIEVTSVRAIPATASVKYAAGESVAKNVWITAYEQELGIKLKYLWTVDSSQLETKSNVMIASGDLPDFFEATAAQFNQLNAAGLLQDMTKAYDDYASPYTKQVIGESGTQQLDSAKVDGKLMAVPFTGLPKEGVPMLYVRMDWLKKLNLSEPKTMDDVMKIAKAFTKQDPDGNGKNDTFGLALDNSLYDFAFLKGLAYGYHAYPKMWVDDGTGNIVYGSIRPEMKTVLSKLQEMYKDGEINKEFGSKDPWQTLDTFPEGKYGMFYGLFWSPNYPLLTHKKSDNKADWQAFPIVSADSKPALVGNDLGVMGYWVVKKGAKNPEAVLKMLNLYTKTFYENTSDDIYKKYVNAPDGSEIWQNAQVQAYRGFKNLAGYQNINAVIDGKKQVSELTPEEKGNYDRIQQYLKSGNLDGWSWDKTYGVGGSMGVIGHYKDNNLYLQDKFYGAPTSGMTKNKAALDKLEVEAFTKIIMGTSIDSFDKFVDQWKKLGGDQITKEVNDLNKK